MAVHGTFLNLHDRALDLVAGRDALDLGGCEHDVGGLDHRVALLALFEAELLHCFHGDVSLDRVVAATADGDDGVDSAFLDGLDGALDLVASADLHDAILSFGEEPTM